MTGWLIVNGFLHSDKFDELTKLFLEAAQEENITLLLKSNEKLLVDTQFNWTEKPDFVLFWDKDIFLAKALEAQGIRLYNSVVQLLFVMISGRHILPCRKPAYRLLAQFLPP